MMDLFTKQEKIFISFLLGAIIIGAGVKIYRHYSGATFQLIRSGDEEKTENEIQIKAALIDSLLTVKPVVLIATNDLDKPLKTKRSRATKVSDKTNLLIEINSATAAELVRLPQIGPVLAERIVDYRTNYGAFKNIEELKKVKGVGEKKMNSIRPYIYIEPKK